jgi:hypothetical protein
MTEEEFQAFVEEVKGKGFTHVKTYGGILPLDKWFPYGLFGGVNSDRGSESITYWVWRFFAEGYFHLRW